ncbi:MAG: poly-gamma-glutamate hydrolase family protein [Syntrophomonadaceae bacterium]
MKRLRLITLAGFLAMLLSCTMFTGLARADIYKNFAQLKAHEKIGVDYRVTQTFTDSTTMILAIHGGNIERETDDIARAVARIGGYDYYEFIGLAPGLHLTSTRFNDPAALTMVKRSDKTLSIHGCRSTRVLTYVGGQDKVLAARVKQQLTAAGFTVQTAAGEIGGNSDSNICNRNSIGRGAQIELTAPLRTQLANSQDKFDRYVSALLKALN